MKRLVATVGFSPGRKGCQDCFYFSPATGTTQEHCLGTTLLLTIVGLDPTELFNNAPAVPNAPPHSVRSTQGMDYNCGALETQLPSTAVEIETLSSVNITQFADGHYHCIRHQRVSPGKMGSMTCAEGPSTIHRTKQSRPYYQYRETYEVVSHQRVPRIPG